MRLLVVGAGVVGLAVARHAAREGHEVVVAEAAARIGAGVSARSSEVVHGGMYYPPGSLRARHCVRGRRLLYAYAEARAIAHKRCGKLIVATEQAEVAELEALHARGEANGVEGLRLVDAAGVRALEPELRAVAALVSPETGIVDSHAFLHALRADLEDAGGAVALRAPVAALARTRLGWLARVGGPSPGELVVDAVVNAAALGAQALARATEGYPAERVPRRVLAKGSYFALKGPAPFTHLVYPAPVEGGLGTHVTLDLAGRARFGPDVEWVLEESYDVIAARAPSFYASVRRYWPGLPDGGLEPAFAGVRPKVTGPGEPPADFVVDGPSEHGLAGLVQLFGIESPGLTSSMSLAEDIVGRLG